MEYNTEDHLFLFSKIHKINLEDIGIIGYPLSWIIGDIKHNELNPEYTPKRYLDYSVVWQKKLYAFANKCKPMILDIYIE
jgi:hypothetical protein